MSPCGGCIHHHAGPAETGPPEHIAACVQLKYLGALVDWLARQDDTEGGRLSGLLDLGHIGVAGHSRGAKLAALHFAGVSSSKTIQPCHAFSLAMQPHAHDGMTPPARCSQGKGKLREGICCMAQVTAGWPQHISSTLWTTQPSRRRVPTTPAL